MHGNVFDAVDRVNAELERPRFVSDAGRASPVSLQLAASQNAHLDQRDYHVSLASGSRPNDLRPMEAKAGIPDLQQGHTGDGGNGSGGGGARLPCADCKTPQEVAHCIKYGSCVSYQNGGGGGGGGGVTGGGGGGKVTNGNPPRIVRQRGGGGGGGLLGPGALGGLKLLPNVPVPAPGTSPAGASSSSPLLLVGIIAVVGVGGYFLWHRLRMARHQDKELDTGKEPTADAA